MEHQHLGEAIEVHVSVQHGEPAMLGSRRRDQGVGGGNTVLAIAALGKLTDRASRRVCDGAVVAQDAQRVELRLERNVFRLVRAE